MSKDNFITVYMPIAGWKAVEMYWETEFEETFGGYWAPWDTAPVAHATKEEAIKDAKYWAQAEMLEYRDTCPKQTDDAPDKSVGDQLREILGDDLITVELKGE